MTKSSRIAVVAFAAVAFAAVGVGYYRPGAATATQTQSFVDQLAPKSVPGITLVSAQTYREGTRTLIVRNDTGRPVAGILWLRTLESRNPRETGSFSSEARNFTNNLQSQPLAPGTTTDVTIDVSKGEPLRFGAVAFSDGAREVIGEDSFARESLEGDISSFERHLAAELTRLRAVAAELPTPTTNARRAERTRLVRAEVDRMKDAVVVERASAPRVYKTREGVNSVQELIAQILQVEGESGKDPEASFAGLVEMIEVRLSPEPRGW